MDINEIVNELDKMNKQLINSKNEYANKLEKCHKELDKNNKYLIFLAIVMILNMIWSIYNVMKVI